MWMVDLAMHMQRQPRMDDNKCIEAVVRPSNTISCTLSGNSEGFAKPGIGSFCTAGCSAIFLVSYELLSMNTETTYSISVKTAILAHSTALGNAASRTPTGSTRCQAIVTCKLGISRDMCQALYGCHRLSVASAAAMLESHISPFNSTNSLLACHMMHKGMRRWCTLCRAARAQLDLCTADSKRISAHSLGSAFSKAIHSI